MEPNIDVALAAGKEKWVAMMTRAAAAPREVHFYERAFDLAFNLGETTGRMQTLAAFLGAFDDIRKNDS
jgi:hypothetical protein